MKHARLRSAALAVAVAAGVAACESTVANYPGNDNTVPPSATVVGTFALETVNAQPLPAEMRHDASGSVSVLAGQLKLNGTVFSQTLTLMSSDSSGVSSTRASATQGSFTMRGSLIHFQATDGGQWDGIYNGSRVDYAVPGNSGPVSFSFRRVDTSAVDAIPDPMRPRRSVLP
jgi:hypothetical protein